MKEEELYLVYINVIGQAWEGEFLYEFLFSNETEEIEGDNWDAEPALGNPQPPNKTYIKQAGTLTNEVKLIVAQNSETFSMYDSMDGVIALAYEDLTEYADYPDNRIVLMFGEPMQSVIDKFYAKDIPIDFKKKKKYETN